MLYYLRNLFFLTLVYLALTANLQLINVVTGMILSAGIVYLVNPERNKSLQLNYLPTLFIALGRYIVVLAYDLLMSGIQVAGIVLQRKMPIHQGIVAIPSECQSTLGTALSAHAITLTPGEMVLEIDDRNVMYTHCLDARQVEEVVRKAQQQRREMLDKIFA